MKRRSWRRPQIQPPDWSIRADERIGPLRVGGDGSRRIEGGNSVTTTPIDVPIDEFFNFFKITNDTVSLIKYLLKQINNTN